MFSYKVPAGINPVVKLVLHRSITMRSHTADDRGAGGGQIQRLLKAMARLCLVANLDRLRGRIYLCKYGDRKWARHPAPFPCA